VVASSERKKRMDRSLGTGLSEVKTTTQGAAPVAARIFIASVAPYCFAICIAVNSFPPLRTMAFSEGLPASGQANCTQGPH
jgi:hypothetical protein